MVVGAFKNMMGGGNKNDGKSSELEKRLACFRGEMYKAWDDFCDKVEASDNEHLQRFSKIFLRRLSVEAPVVVAFVFLCTVLHLVAIIFPGFSLFWGVDDFFSPTNPLHYIRQLTHVFMHDGIQHLRNNMTHMLLVGPSSEAVFGSKNLVLIILSVAISSAWAHILLGRSHTRQLGASGVCFSLILLNSLVSAKLGKIPVSFVLTAMLWLGDEFFRLLLSGDNVSHHAHLVGGIVGTFAGYAIIAQSEGGKKGAKQSGQPLIPMPGMGLSSPKKKA